MRRYNDVLRRAADIQPHDHVLDIGCGTGLTTRQAARAAAAGSAHGWTSRPRPSRAPANLAAAEGLRNVTFTQADAQDGAEYTVGVPVQYRNTEYVKVRAASEPEAVRLALAQVDGEAVIRRAILHDEGVATVLAGETWAEEEDAPHQHSG